MTPEELAVVEKAAETECVSRWNEDECERGDCLSCMAARLLPPLRCACGKWELRRFQPSLWEMPINHTPAKCEAPPPAQRCATCNQVLR